MSGQTRLGRASARVVWLLAVGLVPATLVGCSSANGDGSDGGRVSGEQGYYDSSDPTVQLVAPDDRQPAPDLSGELIGGGSFSLDDVRGDDIVVVNVWGSWCGPCRAEAATLETVYSDLADDGVQFLGLNTRDKDTAALAFMKRYGVSYPNLDDNDALLQLAFRDSLPAAGIPTTWVIDREGRVAARTVSGLTEARLRAMIAPILDEPAPTGSPSVESTAPAAG